MISILQCKQCVLRGYLHGINNVYAVRMLDFKGILEDSAFIRLPGGDRHYF